MARMRLSLTVSGTFMIAIVRACRSPEGGSTFDEVVDIAEGDPAIPFVPVAGEFDRSTLDMMVVACRLLPLLLEIST